MADLHQHMDKMKRQYQSQPVPDKLHRRLDDALAFRRRRQKVLRWARRIGGSGVAAMLALCIVANTSAAAAQALSGIPVLGTLVHIFTFRQYEDSRNGVEIKLQTPHISGLGDPEAERLLNEQFDAYADQLIAQYEADVAAMEGLDEGHESIESTYKVCVDNDRQLTIGMSTTILMAGSMQANTFYNIDKQTGLLVPLSGLFLPDADYVSVLSEKVIAQMREQMAQSDIIEYFIDTDMPELNFTAIRPDQPYYVDSSGDLVLSFDKYEAAPGFMGAFTMTIPAGELTDIILPGGLLDK